MDEQPPTRIPLRLTLDVLLIVAGLVLVSLGAWLGFMDIPPLNLLAKGPS
jgi:hypothetical protein